jgi:hypothetical protein
MKMELGILLMTGFLVMNVYHDNKYVELLKGWKKYYQMGGIVFIALSLYLFIKKNPKESGNMAQHLTGMIKYMPIDRNAKDMLTPLFSMTNKQSVFSPQHPDNIPSQQKRMVNSGGNSNNRSVSGIKKKYVAAQQDWKCGNCKEQLNAWFDVDHKISLEHGGSNHVTNLVALCKNCHGEKTWMENM